MSKKRLARTGGGETAMTGNRHKAGPGLNSHLTFTLFTAAGMFILGFAKPPYTLTSIIFQFSGTLRQIPGNVDGKQTANAVVAALPLRC